MDKLIDTIRAAIIDGAPQEVRAAGAAACRVMLAALESEAGQALATQSPQTAAVPALAQLAPDQVLELVIARLRSLLPADAPAPLATARFQVPLVPTPRGLGGGR